MGVDPSQIRAFGDLVDQGIARRVSVAALSDHRDDVTS